MIRKSCQRILLSAALLFSGCSLFYGSHYALIKRYNCNLLWPVYGEVNSEFGRRGWFSHHNGIDIRAPNGTKVIAAHEGIVIFSGRMNGYGNLVKIDSEDGIATWYGHHSKNLVKTGQHVERGEVIALVGATGNATGPHLHFEVHDTESKNEAIDPLKLYPGEMD